MKQRTRSRIAYRQQGRRYKPIDPSVPVEGPWNYVSSDSSIVDYIEKGKREVDGLTPPSDLYAFKREVIPPILNYSHKYTWLPVSSTIVEGKPGTQPNADGLVSTPVGGWQALEENDSALLASLLAGSNPFRYEISVPVMIAELLEATSLLKVAMRNPASVVGSLHLNWNFGWRLMIQDIQTLAHITTFIENRIKEFNDLISSGGSARRVFLSKRSQKVRYKDYSSISMPEGNVVVDGTITYTSKIWGSVRWKPQRDKQVEVENLVRFNHAARNFVLDLDGISAASAWEALPFSWLADYLINIGDILHAIEGTDLVIPTDVCLMRERRVQVSSDLRLGSNWNQPNGDPVRWASGSPGKVDIVMKNRKVHEVTSLGDLLHFGFFNQSQATNLFALVLALNRFRRVEFVP